jgi:DNA-binding NarL/FixJ family response regulator
MRTTRVLLSVRQQLNAQVLRHVLSSHDGFDLVGEAESFVDILLMLDRHRPELWIHSWDQDSELSSVLSHVDAHHPNLAVVAISPSDFTGFARYPIHSVKELVEFAQSVGTATASIR